MRTLEEIEVAAEALPRPEKEELLLFLATQLRLERQSKGPAPRRFGKSQLEEWIAEDEAAMRKLNEAK